MLTDEERQSINGMFSRPAGTGRPRRDPWIVLEGTFGDAVRHTVAGPALGVSPVADSISRFKM